MLIRVEVRNRFDDLLGHLPDEHVLVIGEYHPAPLYLCYDPRGPVSDLAIRVNGKDWLLREGNRFILKLKSGRTGKIALQFYRKNQHLDGRSHDLGGKGIAAPS